MGDSADGDGVGVTRLPTHYGVLSYRCGATAPSGLRMTISGDLSVPPGGIVLAPPLPAPLKSVMVNGSAVEPLSDHTVKVTAFPADVVLEY